MSKLFTPYVKCFSFNNSFLSGCRLIVEAGRVLRARSAGWQAGRLAGVSTIPRIRGRGLAESSRAASCKEPDLAPDVLERSFFNFSLGIGRVRP